MKPSQRYVSLLATASLVFAGTIQAQQSPTSSRPAADRMDAGISAISRVTKDSVKHRLTAKDLIGASVYDPAGEKIGDIADIDLQGAAPSQLATAFHADRADDRSARTLPPPDGTRPTAERMGDAAERTADRIGDAAQRTARSAASMVDSGIAHASVFVSVGGLWGIGDDLVSVPLAKLSYNTAEDRFELQANKADVVALAERKASDGYAAGSPRSDTAAGKQSFSDEAMRVQKALESDPQTSAYAYKVTVTTDGDSLELRGFVDNKEQKKNIADAAKRATSLDIDNKIEIRE